MGEKIIETFCTGGVGRFVRVLLNFLISKVLLLPIVSIIPGLKAFLENPDLKIWITSALAGLLCALFKKARMHIGLPKWVPL